MNRKYLAFLLDRMAEANASLAAQTARAKKANDSLELFLRRAARR